MLGILTLKSRKLNTWKKNLKKNWGAILELNQPVKHGSLKSKQVLWFIIHYYTFIISKIKTHFEESQVNDVPPWLQHCW